MKRLNYIFLIFICFVFNSNSYAQPKILIDVGEARIRRSLIAMPPFQLMGDASKSEKSGDTLFAVIKNDLDVSGLFTDIKPEAYLEDPSKTALRPGDTVPRGFDFSKWKTIGTEFLIRGGYNIVGKDIHLEIYAYYVPQAQLIIGKKYQGEISSVRKMAHTFANDFIKAVTGKNSFFLSQIVVCLDDGPQSHREVYIADWDGHNARPITQHKNITISPAWSRDGKYIAYTAYVKKRVGKGPAKINPDMFVYEVENGKRWLVSYRDGLNSGAEFLPNNSGILLTLSLGRTVDIYKMGLDGKNLVQITKGPGTAMNVEPAISPDGKTIAFSSTRSGRPMIYTMNTSGGNIKRLTFAGHYNATPTWSADSKKIAFAGFDKDKNNFDTFVMDADGNNLIRLSSEKKSNGKWSNNEDPAFSPDGRHVLFVSDRTGTKQLHIVNVDGSNERQITFDKKFYSKPKWGPMVN